MIGQVIGQYRIVARLGGGGAGTVYKGVDKMVGREVAIKALRPELASDPAGLERFTAEAKALAKLNHPGIATLYSFFRDENALYMAMEYVDGLSLDAVIRRGPMPWPIAVDFFSQVLDCIQPAHDASVLHRDIKPSNIMLDSSGRVRVIDFGLARMHGAARLTRESRLVGTIEYLSPERIRNQEADERSDIYSLGVVLYEMLTGRLPFEASSDFDLMVAHIEEPPPPVPRFAAYVPDRMDSIVRRALAKSPEERYPSCREFRAALDALDAPVQTDEDRSRFVGVYVAATASTMPVPPPPEPGVEANGATSRLVDRLRVLASRMPRFSSNRWLYSYSGAGLLLLIALVSFVGSRRAAPPTAPPPEPVPAAFVMHPSPVTAPLVEPQMELLPAPEEAPVVPVRPVPVETRVQRSGPVSLRELCQFIRAGMNERRIVELVRTRGIQFNMNAQNVETLRQAGMSPALRQALDSLAPKGGNPEPKASPATPANTAPLPKPKPTFADLIATAGDELRRGNYELAGKTAQQSLDLDSEGSPVPYQILAASHLALGRIAQGLEAARTALARGSTYRFQIYHNHVKGYCSGTVTITSTGFSFNGSEHTISPTWREMDNLRIETPKGAQGIGFKFLGKTYKFFPTGHDAEFLVRLVLSEGQ